MVEILVSVSSEEEREEEEEDGLRRRSHFVFTGSLMKPVNSILGIP